MVHGGPHVHAMLREDRARLGALPLPLAGLSVRGLLHPQQQRGRHTVERAQHHKTLAHQFVNSAHVCGPWCDSAQDVGGAASV